MTASSGSFSITSTAFKEGETIPQKYTGDGQNISPPLKWESVPAQAKSFALIADDPDAPMGTWVHWVIFNIPPAATGLSENVPRKDSLTNGSLQGINDSRKIGYDGPSPPSGTHRYYFKLYALDAVLKLSSGITKPQLLKAMEGHILAQTQLMGRYSRK
ncbi:MAG TPA: YbhB/YbcL family Raf kinase inhibitor-like protein [Candidatus Acidoferrales bacterium]|nr:YbhB/YbcL family Raf kinase inhibitor-like protein [Candidatus Acidoferrales bacterium]